jgi:hypothetical protein
MGWPVPHIGSELRQTIAITSFIAHGGWGKGRVPLVAFFGMHLFQCRAAGGCGQDYQSLPHAKARSPHVAVRGLYGPGGMRVAHCARGEGGHPFAMGFQLPPFGKGSYMMGRGRAGRGEVAAPKGIGGGEIGVPLRAVHRGLGRAGWQRASSLRDTWQLCFSQGKWAAAYSSVKALYSPRPVPRC